MLITIGLNPQLNVMKNIFYFVLLLPLSNFGQTTSQNYIKTTIYKDDVDLTKKQIDFTLVQE